MWVGERIMRMWPKMKTECCEEAELWWGYADMKVGWSFAHSFCFFSFAEEITLFVFFLLFLYSIVASFVFSFFHFPYFIFFSLTASATSSFHHHVSLCLRGPFVIPHYVLSRFHHYTFHLLPVIIYTDLSILLPLPYLQPWICTPHMSFPPSASIHALLAQTSKAMSDAVTDTTGVNPAGDAGDTSPNILVGVTSTGISPQYYYILSDIADQYWLPSVRSVSSRCGEGCSPPTLHPIRWFVPPTLNSRWRHWLHKYNIYKIEAVQRRLTKKMHGFCKLSYENRQTSANSLTVTSRLVL